LTVVLAALAPSARAATALPFTADDVAGARAQATARKLPLFVEVWAPW
jgi:hypothetical protein